MLTITNVSMMRNFEVVCGKYGIVRVRTGGHFTEKWVTK